MIMIMIIMLRLAIIIMIIFVACKKFSVRHPFFEMKKKIDKFLAHVKRSREKKKRESE
jgi:hypothetical protein